MRSRGDLNVLHLGALVAHSKMAARLSAFTAIDDRIPTDLR